MVTQCVRHLATVTTRERGRWWGCQIETIGWGHNVLDAPGDSDCEGEGEMVGVSDRDDCMLISDVCQ